MFDYTHVMTARKEYENRAHMHQDEPGARITLAGPLRRAAARFGGFLVDVGSWLKAQDEPMAASVPVAPETA